ncbi:hypothetical protein F4823DRAFT_578661 [Ustulina deusta]|nr:hypothetical protein F4823DRAFT_578661 [Ustulina deusta]
MHFSIVTALLGASLVYAAPASTVKKSESVAKTETGQISEAPAPWPLYVAKDGPAVE